MDGVINVWFDFGCPFSYLLRRVLSKPLAESGTRACWHARDAESGVLKEPVTAARIWKHSVRPLAGRLGVAVSDLAPRPVSTRLAVQGYQYALDRGRGCAYREQVFSAFFARAQDVSRAKVLAEAAGRAGLDPEHFEAVAGSRYYLDRHLAAAARCPSVRTTPTLGIGDYVLEGVPGDAQLARLLAANARSWAGGRRVLSEGVIFDMTQRRVQ
ncbi:DsbA family oxidoreductase [Streptomyces pratensis]|uniref:DsbA family oxidoreductase n=1 Tax=Streptomyces pratensis TaxID=1169025 RepID=UPI0030179E90